VNEKYTFYFAGELFSSKHLLGNAVLAEAIGRRSGGRYEAVLPQDLEQRIPEPQAIRDQDIRGLLHCDLGLFNYDGPELDSGTVVEFLFAKFADIPAVLLRTDFRQGGDQDGPGEQPWNLMTSFYPRTRTVLLNAMALYQSGLQPGRPSSEAAVAALDTAADAVIAAFDALLAEAPVLPAEMRETVYGWLGRMPSFAGISPAESAAGFQDLARQKSGRGLL
jgi:nucleoside 2-deoxyribosyltransferase